MAADPPLSGTPVPPSLTSAIRLVADPLILSGHSKSYVDQVLWDRLRVSIGLGGKGTAPGPVCPYCGAFGGGGHGGLCPGPPYPEVP